MSEHMSDPQTTSETSATNGLAPLNGSRLTPEPPRRSVAKRLGSILGILILGFGGGVAGYAVANEVWQDSGSGSNFTVQASDRATAPERRTRPAAEGEQLTPGDIYDLAGPAVVHITSTQEAQQDFFGWLESQPSQGVGSGFVIDDKGHIVTNAHVVQDADKLQVSFDGQQKFDATLVGEDAATDLAVIKVDPSDKKLQDALKPVKFGDSTALRVGDPVVAIGNPFSLDRTLTTGVVSALQRDIPSLRPQVQVTGVIQTDAAVNPGNSGGPLLNMEGQVIGVNSQIQSRGGDFAGVAFAIPAKTVVGIVEQIIDGGVAEHAWLGIEGGSLDASVSDLLNLPVEQGVLVARVDDKSPAGKLGLKGGSQQLTVDGRSYTLGGDIITKFDGKKLTSMEQLVGLVNGTEPGQKVKIEYYRGKERQEAELTMGARPPAASSTERG